MRNSLYLIASSLISGLFLITSGRADPPPAQFERGKRAVESMVGCYLVDYSYVELEAIKPGYQRDSRVYDVNKKKSVKEWIYSEKISNEQIRLQHVLFLVDLDGKLIPETELRHQAEDWHYNAPFLYDFVGPLKWNVKTLASDSGLWTRKITNLDDGLRYQCAGTWELNTAYPEWSCSNFAPIPGRETRDMGRKDYNTLQRGTRIIAYGNSWLERQNNVKTIYDSETNSKTPLVREEGKNWYIRLPDSECAPAKAFMQPREGFWSLSRETWSEVLNGSGPFIEKIPPNQPPRFVKMMELEEKYLGQNLSDSSTRKAAKEAILQIIREYRAN